MENPNYASRLRYVDADAVENAGVDFDGLDVLGSEGERIGDVDGFVIDPDASRLYYVVVDSGGWFRSRRFLRPVGHARLDAGRRALVTDVTKSALVRYPEFDEQRFRTFSDEELRAFDRRTVEACCPDEPIEDVSVGWAAYEGRRHHAQPDWWARDATRGERLRPVAGTGSDRMEPTVRDLHQPEHEEPGVRDLHQREHVMARADEREGRVSNRDDSPHYEGRAQPGDVLGIETGGERTHMGETAADEDKRRQAAERSAADDEHRNRSGR